jgi:hypothetical protein
VRASPVVRPRALVAALVGLPAALLFAQSLRIEWARLRVARATSRLTWTQRHLTYEAALSPAFFKFTTACSQEIPQDASVLFIAPPKDNEYLYYKLAYMLYPRVVVPYDVGDLAFRNLAAYGSARDLDLSGVRYVAALGVRTGGSLFDALDVVATGSDAAYTIYKLPQGARPEMLLRGRDAAAVP